MLVEESPPNIDATTAATADATLKEKRWTIPKGQWDILTVVGEFALDRARFFFPVWAGLGWDWTDVWCSYVRTRMIRMMNTVLTPALFPMPPRPRS